MISRLFADPMFLLTLGGTGILLMSVIQEREDRPIRAILACLLVAQFICIGLVNHAVTRATPNTVDAAIGRIDLGLSSGIYYWVNRHLLVRLFSNITYLSLGLVSGFVLCVSPARKRTAFALLLVSLPAPFFYYLFPAVGPAHLGDPLAARNCMPSMHLTWAILLARYADPRIRLFAWMFAAATAFATLATGEHYWLDLVAATLYSLMAMAVTRWSVPLVRRWFSTATSLWSGKAVLPTQVQA